jgi:transcriptional regulator
MTRKTDAGVELLQGTLDLLILRTLLFGPAHGHSIARNIRQTSEELLRVETGSLYPALHRLEARGWIEASWEKSDLGKRAKYYRLTRLGRKELVAQRTKWEAFSRAVGLILNPAK